MAKTKPREKPRVRPGWIGAVGGDEILSEPDIRKRVSAILDEFRLALDEHDFTEIIKKIRLFLVNRAIVDERPSHAEQKAALNEGLSRIKKMLGASEDFLEYLDTLDVCSLRRLWQEFGSPETFYQHYHTILRNYSRFWANVFRTRKKIISALSKAPKDSGPIVSDARLTYVCQMAPIFEKTTGKKATVSYRLAETRKETVKPDIWQCPYSTDWMDWEACQKHQANLPKFPRFSGCPTCSYKHRPSPKEREETEGEYYGSFLDFMDAFLKAFDSEWATMKDSVRASKIRGYLEKRLS